MAVFSNPVCPMPMESTEGPDLSTEFYEFEEQFLAEIPGYNYSKSHVEKLSCPPPSMTCLQQPPEQPLLDSFPFRSEICNGSPSSMSIVKQEELTGFLAAWSNPLPGFRKMEIDKCPPEAIKQTYSKLVKEELYCKIKLKQIEKGEDIVTEVTDNQPVVKEYEVSEATKQMQKKRKEKNREAAKKCRQKKKANEREQELKIRAAESEIQRLRQQLEFERRDFSSMLESFPNIPCFLAYLRQNKHLLKNPTMKTVMQRFVRNHGGSMATTCLMSHQSSHAQQTMGFSNRIEM